MSYERVKTPLLLFFPPFYSAGQRQQRFTATLLLFFSFVIVAVLRESFATQQGSGRTAEISIQKTCTSVFHSTGFASSGNNNKSRRRSSHSRLRRNTESNCKPECCLNYTHLFFILNSSGATSRNPPAKKPPKTLYISRQCIQPSVYSLLIEALLCWPLQRFGRRVKQSGVRGT